MLHDPVRPSWVEIRSQAAQLESTRCTTQSVRRGLKFEISGATGKHTVHHPVRPSWFEIRSQAAQLESTRCTTQSVRRGLKFEVRRRNRKAHVAPPSPSVVA